MDVSSHAARDITMKNWFPNGQSLCIKSTHMAVYITSSSKTYNTPLRASCIFPERYILAENLPRTSVAIILVTIITHARRAENGGQWVSRP